MVFLDLAQKRCAVRQYAPRKVEKEKLDLILKAGRVAPTACNNQPQRLIVVQEEENLRKLAGATNHLYGAPLAIIVCCDTREAWTRYDGKKSIDVDASIVTDHMMLEATELGLSTLWDCGFKPDLIRKEFALPDLIEPVNILVVGYATDGAIKSPQRHDGERKPLSETVFYETFLNR